MIDAFMSVLAEIQGWLFDSLISPAMFALGVVEFLDEAYTGTELFLLGVVQILLLYALLRPLESLRPAEVWADRRAVRVDVLYTLIHRLGLFGLATFLLLGPWLDVLAGTLRLEGWRTFNLDDLWPGVTSIPLVAFLLYLVVFDFVDYWMHRAQHRFDGWWSLHSLHHSQRQMSLWSDNRNHLVDDVLRDVILALVALVIGVPPAQFVLLIWLTRAVESVQHANIRLPFGWLGERLVVSPRFHRRHHAIGDGHEGQHLGCNFAVLLPVWDILFGTADYRPGVAPTGIRDQLPRPLGQDRDYGHGFWSQQWLGLQRLWRWRRH